MVVKDRNPAAAHCSDLQAHLVCATVATLEYVTNIEVNPSDIPGLDRVPDLFRVAR